MDFNLFSQNSGYLHLILGSMFSGKTTELIRIYNKYTACGIKCLMINHSCDTRYSNEGHVTSHSKGQIKSLNINKLYDLIESPYEAYEHDVILINEGQFFPDLYEVVKMLVDNQKKHVFVCGLDGDFKREKFGQILDLIPLCDNVVKLKAVCQNCKKSDAIYTYRKTNDTEQTIVAEKDMYSALCRNCYITSSSTISVNCVTSS
jgi:thymidine kinase|tara:strand:- start:1014 stop:1625 length:612 start_codon:yes stop_codon:yes gene_type:complete